MIVACWAVKGGSGTTVVASALASVLAQREGMGAVIVDLAGDVPLVLGSPDPVGPGVTEWMAAGADVPADALARLEVAVAPGIGLLPRGSRALSDPERASVLARVLARESRPVVVDLGTIGPHVDADDLACRRAFLEGSQRRLLVTRACYLSMRHATRCPLRPDGVVLVTEPDRALGPGDVAAVVDAPVVASLAQDASVARAVDAGLLGTRLPRSLHQVLRDAA